MTTSEDTNRRPGGRTARNTTAVMAAAIEVLVDRGVDGFSVAEVAARAGVNESTVYRRWGGRENLVLDALVGAVDVAVPISDTGTLAGDLTALLRRLDTFYDEPLGRVIGVVSMGPLADPGAEEVRLELWRRRIDDVAPIVTRAQERGEVADDVDPTAAVELLLGPFHLRRLTLAQRFGADELTAMVDTLVAGLTST